MAASHMLLVVCLVAAAAAAQALDNAALYATELGSTPPNHGTYDLATATCFCNATSWFVDKYTLLLPVTASSSAYNSVSMDSAIAAGKPYFAGSKDRAQCCAQCRSNNVGSTTKCKVWQHYVPNSNLGTGCSLVPSSCGYCILFPPSVTPPALVSSGNYTTVGKKCIGCKNDPHFVGAHGTSFDFNGLPQQAFCLMTDPAFHINMKMRGYLDSRTESASRLVGGKAVRTWIKELGVLWADAAGASHTFLMVARDGKAQKRGSGFVSRMEVDGKRVPHLKEGETFSTDSELSLSYVGLEREGPFDVDVYDFQIGTLLSAQIKLRVAHPRLQTSTEAHAHINLRFNSVKASSGTHGVLGQTFLPGREKRTLTYSKLAQLLGHGVAADGNTGKGFLDGTPADYRSSSTLSADCKFSRFHISKAAAKKVAKKASRSSHSVASA